MRLLTIAACILLLALLAACGGNDPGSIPPPPEPDMQPPRVERPEMTVEECEAVGTVVGDIGDGHIHRPGYRCPDGQEPVGSVPSGIEGAVCCPDPAGA